MVYAVSIKGSESACKVCMFVYMRQYKQNITRTERAADHSLSLSHIAMHACAPIFSRTKRASLSVVVADTTVFTSLVSTHDHAYCMGRAEEPCAMMSAVSHLPMLPGPRMEILEYVCGC
jgi:hypothetical protein